MRLTARYESKPSRNDCALVRTEDPDNLSSAPPPLVLILRNLWACAGIHHSDYVSCLRSRSQRFESSTDVRSNRLPDSELGFRAWTPEHTEAQLRQTVTFALNGANRKGSLPSVDRELALRIYLRISKNRGCPLFSFALPRFPGIASPLLWLPSLPRNAQGYGVRNAVRCFELP